MSLMRTCLKYVSIMIAVSAPIRASHGEIFTVAEVGIGNDCGLPYQCTQYISTDFNYWGEAYTDWQIYSFEGIDSLGDVSSGSVSGSAYANYGYHGTGAKSLQVSGYINFDNPIFNDLNAKAVTDSEPGSGVDFGGVPTYAYSYATASLKDVVTLSGPSAARVVMELELSGLLRSNKSGVISEVLVRSFEYDYDVMTNYELLYGSSQPGADVFGLQLLTQEFVVQANNSFEFRLEIGAQSIIDPVFVVGGEHSSFSGGTDFDYYGGLEIKSLHAYDENGNELQLAGAFGEFGAYNVALVPEPEAQMMLVAGLVLIAGLVKRRG